MSVFSLRKRTFAYNKGTVPGYAACTAVFFSNRKATPFPA